MNHTINHKLLKSLINDPVLAVQTLFGIELNQYQKARLRVLWFEDSTQPQAIRTCTHNSKPLIITEGEVAASKLNELGIPAIAVPGHTLFTSLDELFNAIKDYDAKTTESRNATKK
jgi:2-methylisocitrate lyase-like PEP mutase family enzyme